jgi:hypothetical protein
MAYLLRRVTPLVGRRATMAATPVYAVSARSFGGGMPTGGPQAPRHDDEDGGGAMFEGIPRPPGAVNPNDRVLPPDNLPKTSDEVDTTEPGQFMARFGIIPFGFMCYLMYVICSDPFSDGIQYQRYRETPTGTVADRGRMVNSKTLVAQEHPVETRMQGD